jgi:threonine dehydratase
MPSQDDDSVESVALKSLWSARRRIAPYVRRTPLEYSPVLSQTAGCAVWLKLECWQETGSFKVRGAASAITRLPQHTRARGVITFSTGNHGLAVAWMARQLGVNATVCVSRKADPAKTEAIRRQGATLIVEGEGQDDAELHCYTLAKETGAALIKPFDDAFVIAGQGTIALELLEERSQIDTVVVPVSGGGLIGGIATALKQTDPRTRVVGVSMEGGAAMHQSLAAGRPVVAEEQTTLADSLQGGIGKDNRYTYGLVQRLVDDLVLVSERAIAEAMTFLLVSHRLLVEGAAAVGVAAILQGKVGRARQDVVAIISGRNVDPARYVEVVGECLRGPPSRNPARENAASRRPGTSGSRSVAIES